MDKKPEKPTPTDVVRLSINVSPELATLLKARALRKGLSITESIRRAVVVWDFFESERVAGRKIFAHNPDGSAQEIVLI